MFRLSQSACIILALAALVVMVGAADTALGCPTCKDGLGNESSNLAQGYFWSIVFMMSMPFLILTGLGCYFYLLVRSARLRAARQGREAGVQAAIDS